MNFRVVRNRVECKKLWNKFSPQQSLWDLFDVRDCFHNKSLRYHFIVGEKADEILGILPLVYDTHYGNHYFFGDVYPEKNIFFVKDKKNLPRFLDNTPEGIYLHYIDKSEKEFYNFEPDEKRYYLDLRKYNNDLTTYLQTFKKKRRKNLRNELKALQETGFTIHHNRIQDLTELVKLNKKRFKDSDFKDKEFVKSIQQLMELAQKKGWLHMISCEINNKVEAVDLALIFNSVYYVIATGKNVDISNIGKLMFLENIRSALEKSAYILDFCADDAGWKEKWHLDSEETFQFVKE